MVEIHVIDCAIKSYVGMFRKNGTRITYHRDQLLTFRSAKASQELPPSLDMRFARSKTRKFGFNQSIPSRAVDCDPSHKPSVEDNMYNGRSYLRSFNDAQINDEAIVKMVVSHDIKHRAGDIKGFYDQPNLSIASHKHRLKRFERSIQEPEWYVNGPHDVEEEMDLHGYHSSPRFSMLTSSDDVTHEEEKENSEQHNTHASTTTHQQKYDKENYFKMDESIQKDVISRRFEKPDVLYERQKEDRPRNVKTLREIESKLNLFQSTSKEPADMTGFYKLLGLIGASSTIGCDVDGPTHTTPGTVELGIEPNPNDHKRNLTCRRVHEEDRHLFIDPAVTEVVDKKTIAQNHFDLKSGEKPNSQLKQPKPERLDVTARVTCNPLTASYQRQVIASGPLGQNALRWFKAMTNAASASACISQHLETNVNDASAKQNSPGSDDHFDRSTSHHSSLQTQMLIDPQREINFPLRLGDTTQFFTNTHMNSSLGLPLYLRSSDHLMNSAFNFGVGMNLTPRPMKPLMYYYHPNATQYFGRPVMHPLLLQQYIQRQMEIRNTALQVSGLFLKSQTASHLASGSKDGSSTEINESRRTTEVGDNLESSESLPKFTSPTPYFNEV